MERDYNKNDASSIFAFSHHLLNRTLKETLAIIDSSINDSQLNKGGKGALGNMIEEFFYDYTPNSDPRPDFPEAGVELKCTPLKIGNNQTLLIKERLVIDMINYCEIIKHPFEETLLYKKFLLMLIIFYINDSNLQWKDMKFIYSVLWMIKDKDLQIIRQDYEKIIQKINDGMAHQISESDTLYLAACTKGSDSSKTRKQPFSNIQAKNRAFCLKTSYMRTILDFVVKSGKNMATNTNIQPKLKPIVSIEELKHDTFENILKKRFEPYYGLDTQEIAAKLGMKINLGAKHRFYLASKPILTKGLHNFEEAEEIKKAGIIAKTIRIEPNGTIQQHMSFENIDYEEIHSIEDWEDSRWYEIVNSRMMFIVFRREDKHTPEWNNIDRYVLDKIIFTSLPNDALELAKEYWENIKMNVENDTLRDANEGIPNEINSFWTGANHKYFHVRPKAKNANILTVSPITNKFVKKKCYWLNKEYLSYVLELAYGEEWKTKFKPNKRNGILKR